MKRILFSGLFLTILFSCMGTTAAIPGRSSDWDRQGLQGPVRQKTVSTYYLSDLSQSNAVRPFYQEVSTFSRQGDLLEVRVFSTEFYYLMSRMKGQSPRDSQLELRPDHAFIYSYTNREENFFQSLRYTNFLRPGGLTQEQEWVYDKQGRMIGESFFLEDSQGRENYYIEKLYDKQGYLIKEIYSGDYRGQAETYQVLYANNLLGQPTNHLQIIGQFTNITQYVYDEFNKLLRKRELDLLLPGIRMQEYNRQGQVSLELLVRGQGQQQRFEHHYRYDEKGNVRIKWVTRLIDPAQGSSVLQPDSFQVTEYQYWPER